MMTLCVRCAGQQSCRRTPQQGTQCTLRTKSYSNEIVLRKGPRKNKCSKLFSSTFIHNNWEISFYCTLFIITTSSLCCNKLKRNAFICWMVLHSTLCFVCVCVRPFAFITLVLYVHTRPLKSHAVYLYINAVEQPSNATVNISTVCNKKNRE